MLSSPADQPSTDMRSLFRDAEARAARLKLLIQVSRDLAAADEDGLEQAVSTAAQRAARFAGYARGAVRDASEPHHERSANLPFDTLAGHGQPGRRLELWSAQNPGVLATEDDGEALRLLAEMIEARLTVALQQRHRRALTERLERRETELEQVLSRVVGAQEAERRAISGDLHDGVAQKIAALHRHLELLQLDLPADGDQNLKAEVQRLIDIARSAVGDLRALIAGLRPTSLDDLGVVAALREEARRLETRGHRVVVREQASRRLPDWLETLIFRVGQEALNNVAKHAPGASVDLDLVVDETAGRVTLSVEDSGGRLADGVVDPEPRFGLEIMRERLLAVAGRLDAGRVEGGFRILATVPLTRT